MNDFNIAESLWDLANLVTGFAIVQTIAAILAVTKGELKGLKGPVAHWIAFGGTTVFAVFYVIAIVWCGVTGSSLDNAGHFYIWTVVTWGRISGVLLFTLVMVGVLWLNWRYEVQRSKPYTP